jgi:lysozyme family protein
MENQKGTLPWYARMFSIMKYDPGFEKKIHHAALMVLGGKDRYVDVALDIGCPWYFVGCLHNMEASTDFTGVLHNGEEIIGKKDQNGFGIKTRLVPIGRGPFDTWEQSAIDALELKGYQHVRDWSLPNILFLAERYNGTGYLKHHPTENSPYIWACTNINDDNGKYVRDGQWSSTAPTNGQVGVAAILKELQAMGEIEL